MENGKPSLSQTLNEMRSLFQEATAQYAKLAEERWSNLSEDDKLYAFYNVCKRIYEADVMKRTSYRGSLYEVFGFGLESYTIGMDCGYLEIHNLIYQGIESKKRIEKETFNEQTD